MPYRTYNSIVSKAEKLGIKTREYWSEEEIKIIIDNYSSHSLEEMLVLLPKRNRNSIIKQANKLKIRNVAKYSKEEEEFIRSNYKLMTDEELGKLLGRTGHTIQWKRISMGLSKIKEDSSYNDLSEYVRRNNTEWKKKSMLLCNYKCVITGERFDDIHHIYGLNKILNETLNRLNISVKESMNDYSDKELRDILDTFREIQDTYPHGVCLKADIHKLFHSIYGFGNNNEAQWEEFITDLRSNKYKDIIVKNKVKCN